MSRTLAQIRTEVRRHLDEATAVKWSDSEILDAVNQAQDVVVSMMSGTGKNIFHQSVAVSMVGGIADLTSLNPYRIVSILEDRGGNLLLPMKYVAPQSIWFKANNGLSLRVVYIAKPTPLANDNDVLNWGNAQTDIALLDKVVALLAAKDLMIKDDYLDNSIESSLAFHMEQLNKLTNKPNYAFRPFRTNRALTSFFNYTILDQNKIQLIMGRR